MTIISFLKLVEIQTKIASVFPFLIGLLFVIYRYDSFYLANTLIFFSAMLLFDLTTTVINNYIDYQKASSESFREEHNRSEEHTSELQSRGHLVCRLLLEKKN